MPEPGSHDVAGLIALWGTVPEFSRATGIADGTVRAWLSRDAIPPENWDHLIEVALACGIKGISLDTLMAAFRIGLARRRAEREQALLESTRRGTRPERSTFFLP